MTEDVQNKLSQGKTEQDAGDAGSGQTTAVPEVPILPLLSTVVFPGTVMTLNVGKKRNLALFESIADSEPYIGLLVQRNAAKEFPWISDLYNSGVYARVISSMKTSLNTVQVFVKGVCRMRVKEFTQEKPFYKARIELIENIDIVDKRADIHITKALELFEQIVALDPKIPEEYINIVRMNMEGPGALADQIASYMGFHLKEKQRIVETVDPVNRLKILNGLLEYSVDELRVKKKVLSRTNQNIEDAKKDYYLRQQMKAIREELGEDAESEEAVAELEKQIEGADLPDNVREVVNKEFKRIRLISPSSSEYHVIRNYLDTILELPWKKFTEDNLDLNRAKAILDEDHYGLDDVKERILEFLAVRKLTDSSKGSIVCLAGPPGVGKTSIGKSIARALGRKFIRISLGGLSDENELRGHRRTYIGAMPGKIIQQITRSGSSNPVFMLDEIDKIGQDFRGDPASAMLEILDPEQNNSFLDLYVDIPFDLSAVMFIATANLLSPVPPALLDRMEVIRLAGYTMYDKHHIARKYLIPQQTAEKGLKEQNIIIDDGALDLIINRYTSESGVRNLEREIATLCRKVARKIATDDKQQSFDITEKSIEDYLGPFKYERLKASETDRAGVATGLAWTQAGGKILFVEALAMKGNGQFKLTGQLGDVMRESAQAALSYIRSRAELLEIDEDIFPKTDIHLHVPSGATPKDGPSAGITIVLVLASLLTGRPVRHDIAMTGEITLSGDVLAVGGVKEKVIAAHNAGIDTVILPKENERDLVEIPEEVRSDLNFVFISHIDEVFGTALLHVFVPKTSLISELTKAKKADPDGLETPEETSGDESGQQQP